MRARLGALEKDAAAPATRTARARAS
jgi:hypothetical protein